ncbi:alpha/beta hydrolase [Companilactobacillus halodurans]|uniref:Esterase family protein n=1 Tax=Companilactobacillus halodurans TaxID=2584183 RepID=A0A5P0ZNA1_9LACO|nr:alpha/beta hydrolase family protein [Companilactobacillus halodurans]MQS75695.1 esterase family protein [Companilactobacillus halodurans]MQS97657.1 esterase family protein [Companilactobacillus halodurans]
MAHLKVNYFSNALLKDCQMDVLLPQKTSDTPNWNKEVLNDLPVIYLMHGMSDDNTAWLRKTRLERLIKSTPVAVILPNADLSWYSDTSYGMNYYDDIAVELPKVIQQFFPQISTKREKNFLVGTSMGGYGAYKIALSTNNFSYAASLSGAFNPRGTNKILDSFRSQAYWNGVINKRDDFANSPDNLKHLVEQKMALHEQFPNFYAWCGKQDFLYDDNLDFVNFLKQRNIPITDKFTNGKHDWYYWDKFLEDVLEWLPISYLPEERLC